VSRRDDRGQTTAEYALVIVAAAVIAVALITWAAASDALPAFFESIVDRIRGMAGAGG
jgi:Flp pilus assembly pilin Flp